MFCQSFWIYFSSHQTVKAKVPVAFPQKIFHTNPRGSVGMEYSQEKKMLQWLSCFSWFIINLSLKVKLAV